MRLRARPLAASVPAAGAPAGPSGAPVPADSRVPRVDSIMLLEEGFQVTSVDASDKMLKYALKERWERRKEEPFDRWGAGAGGGREWRADTNTHLGAGPPEPFSRLLPPFQSAAARVASLQGRAGPCRCCLLSKHRPWPSPACWPQARSSTHRAQGRSG